MNTEASFEKVCVVGLGAHCKNNLIPALISANKIIEGIVSSQKKINIVGEPIVFSNLDDAIKNVSNETCFVLSNPPELHELHILKLVNACRHVFVEKPAFLHTEIINKIKQSCLKNELIFVEMFMYKYTKLYEEFLKIWYKNINSTVTLEITFKIPKIPVNTFRLNRRIYNSALYDIGCYPLSLLVDLNIDLNNIKLDNVVLNNPHHQNFTLIDRKSKINTIINFGVGFDYVNSVKMKLKNNQNIVFEPFFYGKTTNEKIINYYNNEILNNSEKFMDNNGFERMFSYNKNYWHQSQNQRFKNIYKITDMLSKISKNIPKNSYFKSE